MKITIRARFNDAIKFEGEYTSTRHACESNKANLCDANLCGANLCGANLCGADLRGANLYGADLRGANLCDAKLYGANLCDAKLYGADLCGADLRDANLYGDDLRDANLYGDDGLIEKLIVSPVFITGLRWEIVITAQNMKIGCELHTHKEWAEFKRQRISAMDTKAYDWWKEHKDMLLGLCKLNAEAAEKERPAFEKYCEEQEALKAKESAA